MSIQTLFDLFFFALLSKSKTVFVAKIHILELSLEKSYNFLGSGLNSLVHAVHVDN